MKVINIFGTPGSGKSTTVATLYKKLLSKNHTVEIVSESTQDLTKTSSEKITQDNVFKVQKKKFNVDVDYILTDSPILLSVVYDTRKNDDFNAMVLNEFLDHDNLNILLKRTAPYWNLSGRMNEPENDPLYIAMKELLDFYNMDYVELDGDDFAAVNILNMLEE